MFEKIVLLDVQRVERQGEERGEQSTLNAIAIVQVGDNSGIDGL